MHKTKTERRTNPTPNLLAGNSSTVSSRWITKYRDVPIAKVIAAMRMNDNPKPLLMRRSILDSPLLLLNFNNCVTPTPTDAKLNEVRSHARKVRSEAKWSRATDPVFSRRSDPKFTHDFGFLTLMGPSRLSVSSLSRGSTIESSSAGKKGSTSELTESYWELLACIGTPLSTIVAVVSCSLSYYCCLLFLFLLLTTVDTALHCTSNASVTITSSNGESLAGSARVAAGLSSSGSVPEEAQMRRRGRECGSKKSTNGT